MAFIMMFMAVSGVCFKTDVAHIVVLEPRAASETSCEDVSGVCLTEVFVVTTGSVIL